MSSLTTDSLQRPKSMHRDVDLQRPRIINADSHLLNLPPPPLPLPPSSNIHSIRSSPIPGNFSNLPPPPSTMAPLLDVMSTFNKERLHDVLQHGLGTYVFIEHYGLVPKLNHF